MTGADLTGMYEVLYVKDGAPVAEYKCYAASSAAEAQKIPAVYGPTATAVDDVAVMYNDAATVAQMISILELYAGLTDTTPAGYLQYLIDSEGQKPYTLPEAVSISSAETLQVAASASEPETSPVPESQAEAPEKACEALAENTAPLAALLPETAEEAMKEAEPEESSEAAAEETKEEEQTETAEEEARETE